MADEERPSGPPGGKRRRPTTIDVKATEVMPEAVQPAEPIGSPEERTPPEAQAATANVAEPPHNPPPPESTIAAEERPEAAATDDPPSPPRRRWLMASGFAAAAAVLVLFPAIWAFNPFSKRDADPQAARLAALEKQVRDLAAKPAPASIDPRALADLDARVTKAEQAAATPRAAQPDQPLSDRIAALEAAMRPLPELGQKTDAANAAARDAKSRADAAFDAAQKNSGQPAAQAADHKDIEALTARVAALEQAAKTTDEKIARTARSGEADRAGRLAFVAAALRSAAERGDPFAQELAAAKLLAPDASALAPLETFATTGVPRAATLARELSQLSGPILRAAGTAPREGGIFDRLAQNAERLVRIRPINEAPGDDAATVVARAESKAAQGDISGALSELAQLPEPARAPAQGWIKKAEAQVAALAAARKLADNAVGALGKASP
jgi:hypothetical protein